MILDERHFQYGNLNSKEHGIIFAHCDTKSYTRLMGEVDSSTLFNRRNNARYLIADSYEDSPISFDAEIVSDNYTAFTAQQRRTIEKALFNKPEYRKLLIDMDDDLSGDSYEYVDGRLRRLYFNCRFMNPEKIEDGNGLVVGYKFTLECDSCMLWQEPVEKTFKITGNNQVISVETDTDIGGYTYPEVTIYVGGSGGDVIINNITDDASRLTKFNNLSANISLIMKGDINYVSGKNYDKFENQNFIRLLDGKNSIGITGDVTSVKFKWHNRRFL